MKPNTTARSTQPSLWQSLLLRAALLLLLVPLMLPAPSFAQTVSFGPATNVAVGTDPRNVAIGDLNGDGKPDLAVANFRRRYRLRAVRLRARVPLGRPRTLLWELTPFRRDRGSQRRWETGSGGGEYHAATVSVLLGTGAGTFGAATNFAVGVDPAVRRDRRSQRRWDTGSGRGESKSAITSPCCWARARAPLGRPRTLGWEMAPLRRDRRSQRRWETGSGRGEFRQQHRLRAVGHGRGRLWGGHELCCGNITPTPSRSAISTAMGNRIWPWRMLTAIPSPCCWAMARAPLGRPRTLRWELARMSVAIGDLNGDGKPDLAVANSGSNNVSVLLGNGVGGLWGGHELCGGN